MNHVYLILTALAYSISLALYLGFLNTGKKPAGPAATLFLGFGIVAHYFALLERSRGLHTVPYHDLYGSLSLFGWLLALTYLVLELIHRQRSVGAFVVAIVLAVFLASHLAPADRLSPTPAHGPVFALHVTLSILAYAAFALSFVLSLIYLAEERLLRSRRLGNVVWRLPPLDLLERMSRSSVLIGLFSIAVGTFSGSCGSTVCTGNFGTTIRNMSSRFWCCCCTPSIFLWRVPRRGVALGHPNFAFLIL
jgi:ABC-type uncharacterized transport system permease subunit